MKWLASRFKYTKELREALREARNEVRVLEVIRGGLEGTVTEWENTQTVFSKMTLAELEVVMVSIVEYQRCMKMLNAADPIELRVAPIFEKYEITWERNTLVDAVIKEAEEYAKNPKRRSSE